MAAAGREQHLEAGPILPTSSSPDYRRDWKRYRLRRNVALFLLFGWMPVSVGAFLASRLELHLPWVVLALILTWGAALCFAIWYAGEFRCPRCRRRFGALGSRKGAGAIWRGLFDSICYNCKLRKFENG